MTTIHVATTGSDDAAGTASAPLRTISRAAARAMPGDTVIVHEGVYREWVRPARGGVGDRRRIVYQAAEGEHVVIKGSERITGWTQVDDTVWSATVPNGLFGSFNPFAEEIDGDWIVYPSREAPRRHLGDVYLDGRSLYEAPDREELRVPVPVDLIDDWTGARVRRPDASRCSLRWYAEVGAEATTIWVNVGSADPNESLVEISVRRSVFFPDRHGIDYITVRGFELAHAATPWAPPTADQPGLIGPNWAKGWIIEDNVIHDAKCSGISVGKESSTGHNFATERGDKPGYQYQLESVFSARQIGWDREHIGSHVIRRNTIFDCGQTGIVGHLGGVFSIIEDNHIHDIGTKREFSGYEIAGIKLHAAIDVTIRHNRIHDCTLGTWLDWQAQGTRITRNLYYRNTRDLFIEVSHGPYLADHNIFGSAASLEIFSQGGAFVNNLVCGTVSLEPVIDRPTPYHRPHSTQVAGYAAIHGGDDRHIGNIFLGGDASGAYGPTMREGQLAGFGTAGYDAHPPSFEEYLRLVDDPSRGDHERFAEAKQAVTIAGNVYAPGADAYRREAGPLLLQEPVGMTVVEDEGGVVLEAVLPEAFAAARLPVVTGRELGRVRLVGAEFEDATGRPVRADVDLLGTRKSDTADYPAGPLAGLTPGRSRIRIW